MPFINSSVRKELYSYIGGVLNTIECQPVKIGGTDDHIHILCQLSKKITVIKLLEEIKKSSSKWIKTKGNEFSEFSWQDGYGAFTVSPSGVENVKLYIGNQEDHHAHEKFREEYLELLKTNNVEYDEKYLWN
jgi:REP element-mobilizing transposase RayT